MTVSDDKLTPMINYLRPVPSGAPSALRAAFSEAKAANTGPKQWF